MAEHPATEKMNPPLAGGHRVDDFTFRVEDTYFHTSPVAATGDDRKERQLLYQLKTSMEHAKGIDIVVAFLRETGVWQLLPDLKHALDRGARVRLLTGSYLGITEPSALCLLKKELNNRVDLHLYNDRRRSFHPKAYCFHQEDFSEIYIGSSNISYSALTSGIQWNYCFNNKMDKKNYDLFYETFEDLFYHHSVVLDDTELKKYTQSWKKPAAERYLNQYDEAEQETEEHDGETFPGKKKVQPRGAQIEALYALEELRDEGGVKGLVQAATGIGKTYLAAFDSLTYAHVLFVAHREEILMQAEKSFRAVRPSGTCGFFDSKRKTGIDKDVVFASVASLGKQEYLNERYSQDGTDLQIL